MLRVILPKNIIKKLYCDRKIKIADIADRFSCSTDTIRRNIQKNGFMGKKRCKRNFKIEKEDLEKLYFGEMLSVSQIAKKYKCSYTII